MVVIHRKSPYRKSSISFIIPLLLSLVLLIILIVFFSSWLKVKEISDKEQSVSNQIILKNIQGMVLYRSKDEYTFEKINKSKDIKATSYITTDNNSFAELLLYDQNIIRSSANTSIVLSRSNMQETDLMLENGGIWVTKISSNEDVINIITPNSVVKIQNASSASISYDSENKITTINSILGTLHIEVYQIINDSRQIVHNTSLRPISTVRINDTMIEKLKLKEASLDIINDENIIFSKWIYTNLNNDFDIFTNKKATLKELIIKKESETNFFDDFFNDKNNYNISLYQAKYYKISAYLKDLTPIVDKLSNNAIVNSGNVLVKDSADFLQPSNIVEYIKHTVKQGETLSIIANKYKISIDEILKANNNIEDINNINIGTIINIPQIKLEPTKDLTTQNKNQVTDKKSATGATTDTVKNNTNKTYVLDSNGYYTVQPGDTLFLIGQAFGINYLTLAQVNNITEPYKIEVGQKLLITNKLNNTLNNSKILTGAINHIDNNLILTGSNINNNTDY